MNSRVIIGEALNLWIKDELVDAERFYVNMDAMQLIGRGGAKRYFRTRDVFGIK